MDENATGSRSETRSNVPAGATATITPKPAGVSKKSRYDLSNLLSRFGVLIAFVITVIAFSILRPHTFSTVDNLKANLTEASPLAVVAFGLTIVLILGEFDLSFASAVGLIGGMVIVLVANVGFPWPLAVLVGLVVGALAGAVNGILVAYLGAPSFVVTLAMMSMFTGAEYAITGQVTIFEDIPGGYVAIGQGSFLGLNRQVVIAIVVFVVMYLLLQKTEAGRYMHAVGSNREAARLSGLPVRKLRFIGFVVSGVAAAIAGIMITAQASTYSPNLGASLLLPAFAAVFLGSAAFRPGQFNIAGTALGVVFLSAIQSGLTLMNSSPAVINIVLGAILVVAVLTTLAERRLK